MARVSVPVAVYGENPEKWPGRPGWDKLRAAAEAEDPMAPIPAEDADPRERAALVSCLRWMDAEGEAAAQLPALAQGLAEADPEAWAGLTADALGALLRAAGAGTTRDVPYIKADGSRSTRKAYRRDQIADALAALAP
jgi:hypothetical protein